MYEDENDDSHCLLSHKIVTCSLGNWIQVNESSMGTIHAIFNY